MAGLAVALAGPVLVAGCEGEVRTYDVDYHDYHRWNHGEVVYYNNWEHETHRDHQDFAKRSDAEKKEYYSWRHNQNGNHAGIREAEAKIEKRKWKIGGGAFIQERIRTAIQYG